MKPSVYHIQYKIESWHWWFVGRKRILLKQIEKVFRKKPTISILDVGCGTGGIIVSLSKFGKAIGVDNSFEALKFCYAKRIKSLCQAAVPFLPFREEAFDLVLAIDLLEHLDDDEDGLKEFWRVLVKSGKIIIFVPAFKFLWGIQDEVGLHRRRYSLSELKEKVEKSGFKILRISYFNFFLFPIIL